MKEATCAGCDSVCKGVDSANTWSRTQGRFILYHTVRSQSRDVHRLQGLRTRATREKRNIYILVSLIRAHRSPQRRVFNFGHHGFKLTLRASHFCFKKHTPASGKLRGRTKPQANASPHSRYRQYMTTARRRASYSGGTKPNAARRSAITAMRKIAHCCGGWRSDPAKLSALMLHSSCWCKNKKKSRTADRRTRGVACQLPAGAGSMKGGVFFASCVSPKLCVSFPPPPAPSLLVSPTQPKGLARVWVGFPAEAALDLF